MAQPAVDLMRWEQQLGREPEAAQRNAIGSESGGYALPPVGAGGAMRAGHAGAAEHVEES